MTSQNPNEEQRSDPSATGTEPQPVPPHGAPRLQSELRIGKYRIVRLIATGGMSEIYEAEHLGLRKRVALKLLRADLAASVSARQRFLAEGTNAARIRHTNVVDVTDVGMIQDLPYLVMSLLEGEDLAAVFDRERILPLQDLIDVLLPVASAVAAGHAQGIVHRDLKPDNIFLHREGCRVVPKVLDFGISRAMSARRITLNASVFGTPQYMSPEQARGAATDARSDQYALGVILYEGVTGRLPRDSANPLELLHALAFDSFQAPSEHVELPPGLEATILRAMAHEPDARFASMRDLALSLLPFASPAGREYWNEELRIRPGEGAEGRSPLLARHPSLPPRSPLATPARAVVPVEGQASTLAVASSREAAGAAQWVRDSLQPAVKVAEAKPTGTTRRRLFWMVAVAALLAFAGVRFAGPAAERRATGSEHRGSPSRDPAPPAQVILTPAPAQTPAPAPTAIESIAPPRVVRATAPKRLALHGKASSIGTQAPRVAKRAPAPTAEPQPSAEAVQPSVAVVSAPTPRVAVIDARAPRVRLIDEPGPRVEVVQ
jgi:serine/threonine-protein kinase